MPKQLSYLKALVKRLAIVQKKTWTIGLLATLSGGSIQAKESKLRSSKLDFQAYSHDFGTVKDKQKLVHNFKFTNNGNRPLMIYKITSDCQCINIDSSKDRIFPPGKSGFITAELDTNEFNGTMVRSLIVESNEKLTGTKFLTLTANVQNDYQLDHSLILFDPTEAGKTPTKKTVTISETGQSKIKIEKAEYNKKLFKVETSEEDGKTQIVIQFKSPIDKNIQDKLVLTIKGQANKISLPIVANTKENLKISSTQIELGKLSYGRSASKQVQITSETPITIKVTDVRSYLDGEPIARSKELLKIITGKSPETSQKIEFRVRHSKNMYGDFYSKVFIQTSNGDNKVINLYARLLPKHQSPN